jgi:hypothetical protein
VARPAARPAILELDKARLNPCGSNMSTVADAFVGTVLNDPP